MALIETGPMPRTSHSPASGTAVTSSTAGKPSRASALWIRLVRPPARRLASHALTGPGWVPMIASARLLGPSTMLVTLLGGPYPGCVVVASGNGGAEPVTPQPGWGEPGPRCLHLDPGHRWRRGRSGRRFG